MLKKALQQIADLIRKQKKTAIGRLFKSKQPGAGALKRSVREVVKDTNEGYEIRSSMKQYGYYQDSGVRGTGGDGISNRVRANRDSLYKPGQYKPNHKVIGGNLPFAARYYILRAGIKPKPFIKPSVLGVMNEKGNQLIADATAEDVALGFEQIGTDKGNYVRNRLT